MQILCDFFAKGKGEKKSFASGTTCETCCLEGKIKKIKSSQRIGRLIIVQREEKEVKDVKFIETKRAFDIKISNVFISFISLNFFISK